MSRISAALGSTAFFVIAPGFVAGLAPYWINGWRFSASSWDAPALRWLGTALIVAGLAIVVECFVRFVTKGHGTPAPVAPPAILVISGLYRHTRNPMYVGVLSIILGQGLLFGNAATLIYAGCIWVVFTLWVMFYEEPSLRRKYSTQYLLYCANVRRWWPRLRPWLG
jgi:protein-S-isoprenylcysteine O-methyltransferase Ste14